MPESLHKDEPDMLALSSTVVEGQNPDGVRALDVVALEDLLGRRCDIGGGTRVVNCVAHSRRPLTERPFECSLCCVDVMTHLRLALGINEWLNKWKDDATEVIRTLQSANAAKSRPVEMAEESADKQGNDG